MLPQHKKILATPAVRKNKFLTDELLFEFFENFSSLHTRKNYQRDIQSFVRFLMDFFAPVQSWNDVQRWHTVAYKKWLTDIEQSPKTINRKLSSISSFFNFLLEKNLISHNPITGIKRPKQEAQLPTEDLSDEEVKELFKVASISKSPSAPLHLAIIYLLFSTGIRKSELIHLKCKDWFKQQGEHVIRVKAKGGKSLLKVLHPQCVVVLDRYWNWMVSQHRSMHAEDWLFRPTKNPLDGLIDKSLNPKSVDYILKIYCQKAQIFKRISPHSARASYIGSALDQGVDIYRLAQDVGHSSVKTTEEYNKRKKKIKDTPIYHIGYLKKSS